MSAEMSRAKSAVWEGWLRRAPLGVLVLSTTLGLLGGGFILAGAYLGLSRPGVGWAVWVGALLIGPLALFVAVRLLTLTPWTWVTMVLLLGLLLVSSCARFFLTPGFPTVPLVEIVLEVSTLAYLSRLSVRSAFGRA